MLPDFSLPDVMWAFMMILVNFPTMYDGLFDSIYDLALCQLNHRSNSIRSLPHLLLSNGTNRLLLVVAEALL